MSKMDGYYSCVRSFSRNTALRIEDLNGYYIDFKVIDFETNRKNRTARLSINSSGVESKLIYLNMENARFTYGDVTGKMIFPQQSSNKLSLRYEIPWGYKFFVIGEK